MSYQSYKTPYLQDALDTLNSLGIKFDRVLESKETYILYFMQGNADVAYWSNHLTHTYRNVLVVNEKPREWNNDAGRGEPDEDYRIYPLPR